MKKNFTLWSLALAVAIGGGAYAATSLAPSTRAAEVDYGLTPSTGGVVTDLKTIQIEFPNIKGMQFNENVENAITLTNTSTNVVYQCFYPDIDPKAVDSSIFNMTFAAQDDEFNVQPITAAGEYVLDIKEGAFFYGTEVVAEDGAVSIADPVNVQAITATYTIKGDAEGIAYTLDPAAGSEVANFDLITLSFPEIKTVQFESNMTAPIVLKNLDTAEEYECEPVRNTRVEAGTAFELHFFNEVDGEFMPIVAAGAYVLEIKEGAFFYGEEDEDGQIAEPVKVQKISASYSIAGQVAAYSLDPASGSEVENFDLITLSFPTIKGVQFQSNMIAPIVLKNIDTADEYECEPVRNARVENGTTFELHFFNEVDGEFMPIAAAGVYELEIKEGAFFYGEEDEDGQIADPVKVQKITASYSIAGQTQKAAYTLDPASGSEVENFDMITLSFPEIKGVQFQSNMVAPVILKNINTEEEYECEPVRNARAAEGTVFELHFFNVVDEDLLSIVTTGVYELNIKEGAFFYGEEDEDGQIAEPIMVQKITATYSIPGQIATYTLDPVSGSEVENFDLITLSFPAIQGVQFQSNMIAPIVLRNIDTEEEYECEPVRNARAENGTVFELHFFNEVDGEFMPIVGAGVYELEIKEGAFFYGEEDEDGQIAEPVKVQKITASYTIPGQLAAYTLDPVSGSEVENFDLITLSFPTLKGVQFQSNMIAPIVLKNIESQEEYECEPVRNARAEEGTVFELRFFNDVDGDFLPIVTAGVYELEIKEGAFFYGEEDEDGQIADPIKVQKITATYSIPGQMATYTLDPASGSYVDNFDMITLSFPTLKSVQFQSNMTAAIVLRNLDTEEEFECEPDRNTYAEDGTVFELRFYGDDFLPVSTPGSYELEIKEGAFFYGEEDADGQIAEPIKVQKIIANYIILTSGVGQVAGVEAAESNVYGVNGVLLFKNASDDQLKSLGEGLYIVNGKKVLIKK